MEVIRTSSEADLELFFGASTQRSDPLQDSAAAWVAHMCILIVIEITDYAGVIDTV